MAVRNFFHLPLDAPPMAARTAAQIPDDGGAWQYLPKWDDLRCLAFKAAGAVDLRAKPASHPRGAMHDGTDCPTGIAVALRIAADAPR